VYYGSGPSGFDVYPLSWESTEKKLNGWMTDKRTFAFPRTSLGELRPKNGQTNSAILYWQPR